MRPGQNKRMRGRSNNNNRKGPNPLTRSYESNGPDVKIRGTAHHVAEKYLQLARDAQSSGDPVMAESYLQHAEHYFRLIAAAQQAQQQASLGLTRPGGDLETDDDDDDDFGGLPDRFASPVERFPPPPPPPPPMPATNGGNGPQPYGERPAYNNGDRQDRQNFGPRPERPHFNDRNGGDRNGPRPPRPPREYRPDGARAEGRAPTPAAATAADDVGNAPLPAFITAPVRVPTDVSPPAATVDESIPNSFAAEPHGEGVEGEYHLRPRRRRRHRPEGDGTAGDGVTGSGLAGSGLAGDAPVKDPIGD